MLLWLLETWRSNELELAFGTIHLNMTSRRSRLVNNEKEKGGWAVQIDAVGKLRYPSQEAG